MLRFMTRSRVALLSLGGVGAAVGLWVAPAQSQEEIGASGPEILNPFLDYDSWAEPLDPFESEELGLLSVCFDAARPPSDEFIERLNEVLAAHGRLAVEPLELEGGEHPDIEQYQLGSRWSGSQGDPRLILWSFAPDGLNIPNGIGEGAAPNEIFARMDALFAAQGGRATWINRFQQCFDRWAEISGLSYTRVTVGGNDWDDGASWGSGGAAGARGDVRISMKPIDGANGVLAYNSFPSNGDMVIDRAESWGSSSNQHRFLRNTVMHEHGHGMGLFHTCSNDSSILMEPFLSTSFDGPRHDDLRAAHRHYGDEQEGDNTPGTATDLGVLPVGLTNSACNLPTPDGGGTNTANMAGCSIDANGEQDYFLFTLAQASEVTVTIVPLGSTYDDSPQSGSCTTGNDTNSLAIANLNVQIIAGNGATVLGTADTAAIGTSETLANVQVPSGDNYIRVYEGNNPGQSQIYRMDITVAEAGCTSNEECDDGDPCNGIETCDGLGNCVSSGITDCNDNGVDDSCDSNLLPTIVDQPDPLVRVVGQSASFTVAISGGTQPITYQWLKDGDPIPLANGTNYSIAAVDLDDEADYSVFITSNCGPVTSNAAFLDVVECDDAGDCDDGNPCNGVESCDGNGNCQPGSITDCNNNGIDDSCDSGLLPTITDEPDTQVVNVGDPVTFSVAISGGTGPFTYQWYKDNDPINLAESDTYSIASAALTDDGVYRVDIGSACGGISSQDATLTVNDIVDPCPGDFDNDNDIDLDDLLIQLGSFGAPSVPPGTSGDVDGDGDVDLDDLLVLLGVFGTTC